MVIQAALTAARPNSSLSTPSVALQACLTHPCGCSRPSFGRLAAIDATAAVVFVLQAMNQLGDLRALEFLPSVSRPLLGFTLRGQTGALRLGVVLLRLRRPSGVSVPPRTSLKAAAKDAAQTSSGARQESTPWHLGAGPTRSLREG